MDEERSCNLEILYQDSYYVAINKPSGLLVHKSILDKYETRYAMKLLSEQIGQWVYPVHRLDKPTSGVLLFALDSESARRMSEMFIAHEVQKKYIAIVRGYTDVEAIIDYPLSVKFDKIADKKTDKTKEAQEAQTTYKRLATLEVDKTVGRYKTARYSLVELCPKTGRKHQLRRHMKHISHHILGDTKYGRGEHNKMVREHYSCQRLMLHAFSMEFIHPYTKEKISLRGDVDTTWKYFLRLFHISETVY